MMDDKNITVSDHVKDLRKSLLISFIAIAVATALSYVLFLEQLMVIATDPITKLGIDLKFISVSEGFIAHIKITFISGVILASPIIIWQLLRFVLPALYKHERKIFLGILFSALALFLIGLVFGYFIVLRLALHTLIFDFSGQLEPFITINNYLSFVFRFMLPFGLVFEIPLFVYFLTIMGIITPSKLLGVRKYVLIVVLIIAAILTPPDVVSQVLLGIPMYILFELSIILSKFVYNKKQKKEKMA